MTGSSPNNVAISHREMLPSVRLEISLNFFDGRDLLLSLGLLDAPHFDIKHCSAFQQLLIFLRLVHTALPYLALPLAGFEGWWSQESDWWAFDHGIGVSSLGVVRRRRAIPIGLDRFYRW